MDIYWKTIKARPILAVPEFETPPVDIISNKVKEAEEKCVKMVLYNYLQREPLLNDFTRVTRIFRNESSEQYQLAFDSVILGYIKMRFQDDSFYVDFIPFKH